MFAVIDKGGAADSMGFKPGDRVISVDGRPGRQRLGLQAGAAAVPGPRHRRLRAPGQAGEEGRQGAGVLT